jgi:hypothetical protein
MIFRDLNACPVDNFTLFHEVVTKSISFAQNMAVKFFQSFLFGKQLIVETLV